MKTSVMEVRDMLSVLSVIGVEKRIGEVPGVESVTVNFAAGSATVRFDETRLSLADIRSDVRQSGSKADTPDDAHDDHAAPDAPAADTGPVAAKAPPAVAAEAKPAGDAPPGSSPPDKAATGATPPLAAEATPAGDAPPPGKPGKS